MAKSEIKIYYTDELESFELPRDPRLFKRKAKGNIDMRQLSYGFNYYRTIGSNRNEFVVFRILKKVKG